jgi:hypothetical protein
MARSIVHALRPYKKVWRDKLDEVGAKKKAELEAYMSGKKSKG